MPNGIGSPVFALRTIIDAKTAQNAVGYYPDILNSKYIESILYVVFDSTAAAGVVVVETAHDRDYQGTWANIGTVTFASASKEHYVAVTGVFAAIRVRISSAVTSGTVSCYAIGTN
jgi:hypothetical protein